MREPFEVSVVFHFNPSKVLDAVASVFFARPKVTNARSAKQRVQRDMIYHIIELS